jgi:hypothetical protein
LRFGSRQVKHEKRNYSSKACLTILTLIRWYGTLRMKVYKERKIFKSTDKIQIKRNTLENVIFIYYREDFYFVDRFHGSALHGDRCIADCEEHTSFVDQSPSLYIKNNGCTWAVPNSLTNQ